MKQTDDNLHDDFDITAIMLTIDPTSVRMKQQVAVKAVRAARKSSR